TASDVTLVQTAAADDPRPAVTMVATYAGALAILCYAAGFWHVAARLRGAGDAIARRAFLFGAAMAGVGAALPGRTGVTVRYETDRSPAHVVAVVLPLWVLGVACGVVFTAVWVRAVAGGRTSYPPWMAVANPLTLPLAVAALAMLCGPAFAAVVVPT